MVGRIIAGMLVYLFFLMFFWWLRRERLVGKWIRYTFDSLDVAARERVHENRRQLLMLQRQKSFLYKVEQRLRYCGLMSRYRWLTAEMWILWNLAVCASGYFAVLFLSGSFIAALSVMIILRVFCHTAESMLMSRNYRSVNENLLKFLDFLGNYSVTAGEITGIFRQISRYLDEPLKSVLDECYYEAQTSGDVELALLAMAEKIEHPKFKELVRNIEISIRYSADFTALVKSSRRSVREYMRTRQERKGMMTEALINMLLLMGMSFVILVVVERLIGSPMKEILFYSWPGRIGLSVIIVIFIMLFAQIRKLNR